MGTRGDGITSQTSGAEHHFKEMIGSDPFDYTSGRWLRLDDEQRKARRVKFNIHQLLKRVLSLSPSAVSIKSCRKLEGGFSKVFVFTTNDGKQVVAKFPTSVAGPPEQVTDSEVATMTYLKSHTKIPIPAVLDWSDDPSNPIGSAYIIMEHADGISLDQAWPKMTVPQRIKCVGSITKQIVEMSKINFPAYGSLYFSDASFLQHQSTYPVDEKYSIGPSCGVIYWDRDIGHRKYYHYAKPNRGPWRDISEYTSALIDAGLGRLPPSEQVAGKWQRPFQGSIDEHIQLLHSGSKVLQQLANNIHIQNNKAPTMFHSDLNKRNIFVSAQDPMVATGFIDWQLTRVEPAFYYADQVPDFAALPIASEETQAEDKLSEGSELDTLCSQAYAAGLGILSPRLNNARNVDETLLRPFRYCHRTWRDSIVPFTYELLELQKHWDTLGFQESCSLATDFMSSDRARVYREREEIFNDFLEIKKDLLEMVETDDDGWVFPELFKEKKTLNQSLYETIMSDIEDENDWKDMESAWPLDHD
ncbi:hypothetical protein FQN51_002723 [Onygenales sp. PD_10]|nr:hypothetical protein FQN51_002723 [Onygenales sp. PD_10]